MVYLSNRSRVLLYLISSSQRYASLSIPVEILSLSTCILLPLSPACRFFVSYCLNGGGYTWRRRSNSSSFYLITCSSMLLFLWSIMKLNYTTVNGVDFTKVNFWTSFISLNIPMPIPTAAGMINK